MEERGDEVFIMDGETAKQTREKREGPTQRGISEKVISFTSISYLFFRYFLVLSFISSVQAKAKMENICTQRLHKDSLNLICIFVTWLAL